MHKYTFIKIRKIAINVVMWLLLLSLSSYLFFRYVCKVKQSTPTKALNLAIILQIISNYCKKTHPLCDYIRKCKEM